MKMNLNKLDLGKAEVSSLFLKIALPATLGLLINGLYVMIDTIFVGKFIGTMALGGISIAFPIQMLISAFGALFGVGAGAIISRRLGEKNHDRANKIFGNVVVLAVMFSIILGILIFLFIKPLLYMFGATANNFEYASQYLLTLSPGICLIFFGFIGINISRSEGNPKVSIIGMAMGSILNIIFDPIFMIVLDMGVAGAAMATLVARLISIIFMANYFFSGKSNIKPAVKYLKLNSGIIKEIFSIGAGTFIGQATVCIFTIIMNISLRHYGTDLHISLYGVISRLLIFLIMPMFGLSQGFQTITGYNYGAKNKERVNEAIKIVLRVTLTICTVLFLLIIIFPSFILGIFTNDAALIELGEQPLRIMILIFPLIGLPVIATSFFQAIGKALPAIIVSLSRQFLFIVPLILILPLFMGINGLWIAYPIADVMAVLIAALWMKSGVNKINKEIVPLEEKIS